VVISWTHEKQNRLDLFVESCNKLIRELLYRVEIDENKSAIGSRLILFSESHEISAFVGKYKSVLLIVARFEMVAHLLYLKQLIQNYKTRKTNTIRIRIIWQVQHIDKHKTRL